MNHMGPALDRGETAGKAADGQPRPKLAMLNDARCRMYQVSTCNMLEDRQNEPHATVSHLCATSGKTTRTERLQSVQQHS